MTEHFNNITSLIKQTARDYDMSEDIVMGIYKKYPDNFYGELEEELKRRRRCN